MYIRAVLIDALKRCLKSKKSRMWLGGHFIQIICIFVVPWSMCASIDKSKRYVDHDIRHPFPGHMTRSQEYKINKEL